MYYYYQEKVCNQYWFTKNWPPSYITLMAYLPSLLLDTYGPPTCPIAYTAFRLWASFNDFRLQWFPIVLDLNNRSFLRYTFYSLSVYFWRNNRREHFEFDPIEALTQLVRILRRIWIWLHECRISVNECDDICLLNDNYNSNDKLDTLKLTILMQYSK